MMPNQKEYYAIARGAKTGIWKNWLDCEQYVVGFKGNAYKGFSTQEKAIEYLEEAGITNITIHYKKDDQVDQPHTTADEHIAEQGVMFLPDNSTSRNEYKAEQQIVSSPISRNEHTAQRKVVSTPKNSVNKNEPHEKYSNSLSASSSMPVISFGSEEISAQTTVTNSIYSDKSSPLLDSSLLKNILSSLDTIKTALQEQSNAIKYLQQQGSEILQKQEKTDDLVKQNAASIKSVAQLVTDNHSPITSSLNEVLNTHDTLSKVVTAVDEKVKAIEHHLDPNTKFVTSRKSMTNNSAQLRKLETTPQKSNSQTKIHKNQKNFNQNPRSLVTPNQNPRSLATPKVEPSKQMHKELHPSCDKLIIGDSNCKSIFPSSNDNLAVRTYPNTTIEQLTSVIENMPVNDSVEDVSFVTGSLDTKTDSSSFRYHYNKLVDATFNTFPKAYVSICDIIPTSSNDSARESVRLLNDTLRDLCFKRRGVKYITSSHILTHYDGSLRNDLYTPALL